MFLNVLIVLNHRSVDAPTCAANGKDQLKNNQNALVDDTKTRTFRIC